MLVGLEGNGVAGQGGLLAAAGDQPDAGFVVKLVFAGVNLPAEQVGVHFLEEPGLAIADHDGGGGAAINS